MLRGIEPLIVAIRDLIKNNIDTELAAVEAVWAGTDPITLPRPLATSYYISQRQVIEQFPSVVVLGERSVHGIQTGSYEYQAEGAGHEISVMWIDRHLDPETLRKIMYRTALAHEQLFAENYQIGGAFALKVEDVDFDPAFNDSGVFVQSFEIRIVCQTEEEI